MNIVNYLMRISHQCEQHELYCTNCIYLKEKNCSVIRLIIYLEEHDPDLWVKEEIEDIINGIN